MFNHKIWSLEQQEQIKPQVKIKWEELKFSLKNNGDQSVIKVLMIILLMFYVNNLDSLEDQQLVNQVNLMLANMEKKIFVIKLQKC